MTRSAAEVEAEVEASRDELDRNVEALKSKMTPGQLFDEATRTMGGAGQQVASKFIEQAKENPMPLAVMGLGLAWLMMTSNKSRGSSYSGGEVRSYSPRTQGYGSGATGYGAASSGGGLREKAHELGDKASELISGAKDKLSSGSSAISESGRAGIQALGSVAGGLGERAERMRYRAQNSFTDSLEHEPLLIGAAGLLVGAAIGAALPATDAENRLVGPMRDKVVGKGKDVAQTGLQQAADAVQSAYGAVKSELQSGEGDGQDMASRVEGAARAGVQAAKDELQSAPPAH
jgi:hypothetical protein